MAAAAACSNSEIFSRDDAFRSFSSLVSSLSMECPVCLECYSTGSDDRYTTPKLLSCGHSVCSSCLRGLDIKHMEPHGNHDQQDHRQRHPMFFGNAGSAEESLSIFAPTSNPPRSLRHLSALRRQPLCWTCPLCRHPTAVCHIDELPNNHALAQIIEVVQILRRKCQELDNLYSFLMEASGKPPGNREGISATERDFREGEAKEKLKKLLKQQPRQKFSEKKKEREQEEERQREQWQLREQRQREEQQRQQQLREQRQREEQQLREQRRREEQQRQQQLREQRQREEQQRRQQWREQRGNLLRGESLRLICPFYDEENEEMEDFNEDFCIDYHDNYDDTDYGDYDDDNGDSDDGDDDDDDDDGHWEDATNEEACRYFPSCRYNAEHCRYSHPRCRYGKFCENEDCAYDHSCKFYPDCRFSSNQCRFRHGRNVRGAP